MSRTSAFFVTWLFAALALPSALPAQQPNTPTLQEILQRLQSNLKSYDSSIPSFFCDEHIVSEMQPKQRDSDTVIDSVFRLTRTETPNHTPTLTESREIKTINGKPAGAKDMKGPSLLRGAFEGALAIVSLDQAACMNYQLLPPGKKRTKNSYLIRFTTALSPDNSPNCLLQEKSEGRVFIDPASMQITHLELTTPRHTIIPGDYDDWPVVGKRILTVDYEPVSLAGENFWLPSSITQKSISGAGSFHMTTWSYRATYANYHKLEVKSRILPGIKVAVP